MQLSAINDSVKFGYTQALEQFFKHSWSKNTKIAQNFLSVIRQTKILYHFVLVHDGKVVEINECKPPDQ